LAQIGSGGAEGGLPVLAPEAEHVRVVGARLHRLEALERRHGVPEQQPEKPRSGERERERKEAKRKSAEFRGEEVGSQQDLGDEFPQHLRWSGRKARRFPVRACGIEEGGWGKEGGGGEGSSCFGFGETGPE
jgi:hypothetical protein